MRRLFQLVLCVTCLNCALGAPSSRATTNSLVWRTKEHQVDAHIENWDLIKLLRQIASSAGWQVIVEPGISYPISAKFKNQPEDEALRRLLGSLNFAKKVTNGVSQLYVYRTVVGAATQMVTNSPPKHRTDYRIPNELIVRLKANSKMSIDELAKQLGAKVVGRDDRLKLYRLQFDDAASADAALASINSNTDVASVDSNYYVDKASPVEMSPVAAGATGGGGSGVGSLNPKAPVNGPEIGLIDTAVQPQDQFKQYLLPQITVPGASPVAPGTDLSHATGMFETMLQAMPDAPSRILPVDIFGGDQSTTTFELAEGIIAAVNAGANPINLSLGGTGNSATVQALITEGIQKGILFVAASGNEGGTGATYPAAYQGVVAVTASDPSTGQLASYADNGSFVKAMAPGTSMVSLNGQQWIIEGTSPATAYGTGTIMQLENQLHLTPNQAAIQFIRAYPAPK